MRTYNEIMSASSYSDLFSSDENEAKKEFHSYCKVYHPDVDNSEKALKAFEKIRQLYRLRTCSTTVNSSVHEEVIFRDIRTNKGFSLNNPVILNVCPGGIKIYHTATKVALIFEKEYSKLYENYIKQVDNLSYKDDKMEKEFKRYFPKVLKHFELADSNGKHCILLEKTSEVLNLGKIVTSYKARGEKFPKEQAAWIMNRLFNLSCYFEFMGKAFNGFSLENIWVSPEMHTVLLLEGFEYTKEINEKMLGCPVSVFKTLPIKVKDNKLSSTLTDLESIKSIGRELFAGHDALVNIQKYIKAGTDSNSTFDEWDAYGKAVYADFGKREFIIWENVPY